MKLIYTGPYGSFNFPYKITWIYDDKFIVRSNVASFRFEDKSLKLPMFTYIIDDETTNDLRIYRLFSQKTPFFTIDNDWMIWFSIDVNYRHHHILGSEGNSYLYTANDVLLKRLFIRRYVKCCC